LFNVPEGYDPNGDGVILNNEKRIKSDQCIDVRTDGNFTFMKNEYSDGCNTFRDTTYVGKFDEQTLIFYSEDVDKHELTHGTCIEMKQSYKQFTWTAVSNVKLMKKAGIPNSKAEQQ